MFKAFSQTIKGLASNPFLFMPAGILVIFQAFLYMLFFQIFDVVPRFFYEVLALNENVNSSFFDNLAAFTVVNFNEILFLAALSVLWVAGTTWFLFACTSAKELNGKVPQAITASASSIGKIIGLSIFFWVLIVLFFFIAGLIAFVGVLIESASLIALVLLAAWLVIGFVLYLKLAFLPIVFYSEKKKIRESIHLTNEWTKKKLLAIFFVLLITGIASRLISDTAIALTDNMEIEELAIVIMFCSLTITSAFSGNFLVNYYYATKQ